MHTFQNSKKVGDRGEKILDEFFGKKFQIDEVSMELQKLGWDRIFIHPQTKARASVEYKTDILAHKTGNIFLEIWSDKEKGKRGWAYTTTAQWIYYYLYHTGECFIIQTTNLKLYLKVWQKQFILRKSQNPFYYSEGILVPIEVFKTICYEVTEIC